MATTNLTPILSTLFLTIILLHLPAMTMSDDTCPYPCYPPPTGTGSTTPSPPTSQSGSYQPPSSNYPTTPTGNSPYNNYYPPPYFSNNYYGPPPPDPILPYFPYFYRKPPHQTTVNSWAPKSGVPRSSLLMMLLSVFLSFLLV